MNIEVPIWLLLAIPLAAATWMWRPPTRLLLAMRIVSFTLILAAMCGLTVSLPSRAGTVVIVADRSLSMPQGAVAAQEETIDLIQAAMGAGDRLAVVSFAGRAAIERPPGAEKFSGFITRVDVDGSNMSEAIHTAVSLVPRGASGRILLLSDGLWSGRDPVGAAGRAAASRVPIDYRLIGRPAGNDLAIERVEAPAQVTPGESYAITAWLLSPRAQDVKFELTRGGARLAVGAKAVPAGLSRLTFRDTAAAGGTFSYVLRVEGPGRDEMPENNVAKILVGVRGPRPILCVKPGESSALVSLLKAGGLQVEARQAADCRWSLEKLSGYSAVLIENVSAGGMSEGDMETIAAWVTQTGAGLMMTGGRNSYGPGGYFRSPLEAIMPVSMELRREHRKLSLAIVVALDRSGSMAVTVGGGKTKMDLANIASAQVVDLLTSNDEFGVLAVDSAPHVITPLAKLSDKATVKNRILRIDSMGGGIYVYEALSKAAAMLAKAQAGTKHIILFADAADAEQPGKYKELLKKCRAAQMTCSVIGLGSKGDSDANLLRDIAKRGGGRCFFTDKASELPRLFAQDTFVVARSTFLEEPTPVRLTPALRVLTGKSLANPPYVGGYNLCYLRPGASMAAVTADEYKAPLLAAWQAGIGRTLCYTGEADGKYTGAMARWKDVGHFFTSQARWVAGAFNKLPDGMLVTQEVKDGRCVVQLHLDTERESLSLETMPRVSVLRGLAGRSPKVGNLPMRWISPDMLQADVPIHGGETVIATVDLARIGRVSLPPVCRPYSPEFRPAAPGRGAGTLERLATVTGGKQRVDLSGIWPSLPETPRELALAHWLLLAATLVLLMEVLQRRTSLLTITASVIATRSRGIAKAALPFRRRTKPDQTPAPATGKTVTPPSAQPSAPAQAPKTPAPPSGATPKAQQDVMDAFRKARRAANRRTER